MYNFLIRILSKFTKPIDGSPSEWFERPWKAPDGSLWTDFKCGSCRGIYKGNNNGFEILAVQNTKKNRDFDQVLEWFHKSAKRDKCSVVFLEVGNPKLEKKLRKIGYIGTKERLELSP